MAQLHSEVDLIRRLDHPNIVRLQEVFETEDSLFLVMDLCTGGDMMTRWERNRMLRYSEAEAAMTVKKIVNAVRYCHERHVVHRDLKLENLLWEHPGEDAEPQLVDFGLGVTFSDDSDVFREDVGSLYYVAPEVLARNYTKACDCWSIGVIAYMLLSGMAPFMAPSDEGVKLKIKWAKVGFPKEQWERVTDEAKDFIKKMLVKSPAKRMTAEAAASHPWLNPSRSRAATNQRETGDRAAPSLTPPPEQKIDRDWGGEGVRSGGMAGEEASMALDPELVRRLKKFAVKSWIEAGGDYGKLKRVALGVIAHSLTPSEIRKLRTEFQNVDVEGRGVISPVDLQKALNASGNFTAEEVEQMFNHMDVDQDGEIGFTEFLAASLDEGHVKDDNIRLAFSRLDYDNSGKVTMADLNEVTGGGHTDEKSITDMELRSALLGGEANGVSYEVFKRAMKKNFSMVDMSDPRAVSSLVRAASKLSVEELALVTGGSEEDAGTIVSGSQLILSNNSVGPYQQDLAIDGDISSTNGVVGQRQHGQQPEDATMGAGGAGDVEEGGGEREDEAQDDGALVF
eukprot:jgi/Undpi1/2895/HiC_scaffold_14.g06272.m1